MIDIYEGAIVGWNGYRAVVRKVEGWGVAGRAYIHYQYTALERTCQDCQGTGTIVVLRHERASIVSCQACKATGRLPERTKTLRRWVDVAELTIAPPKPTSEPESLAMAMDLLRGPR